MAESTSGAAKQQVVTKICTELTIHAEVEETHVYPAMESAGLADLVSEAEQEHQKVKDAYARAVEQWQEELRASCADSQADYFQIDTRTPVEEALRMRATHT